MASIILASAGAAIGGSLTATAVGALTGKVVGTFVGGMLDSALLGEQAMHASSNGRLESIVMQSAGYGHDIPTVYGMAKLAGNIIWASGLTEHSSTSSETHGSKWHKVRYTHTDYVYTLSFAIAICAGPITGVNRIWANDILLNKENDGIRIYCGDETQIPDSLIESIEGANTVPAYRGLAYVVFENFNLTDFGNRFPHFTFEIQKTQYSDTSVEKMIKAVTIIPGSGEFVYDTDVQYISAGDYVASNTKSHTKNEHVHFVQRGNSKRINSHSDIHKANSLIALDQLSSTLPNVEWAAPVVAWFASSLDGANCSIMPGVEYDDGVETSPARWKVGKYHRATAHKITRKDNRAIYGGTVNDDSVLKYLKELRKRGYKIMFYPLLFVDMEGKPWRGRITCDAQDVRKFFHSENGYNEFILHYAYLTKGLIDTFIIGSELRDLTAVHDSSFIFPAVEELIQLAKKVRTIVEPNVKISYAADWSEYHHTVNGWYNMDPLWASDAVDFVGIDAYFPLTDIQCADYDVQDVVASWDRGEGYDFFYCDDKRTERKALDVRYAWKNITWWWNNEHVNPDGQRTPWSPRAKKIWFTEYGFPSIDLATNQPNIFFDPTSNESGVPYHSNRVMDIVAQRLGIEATEKRWKDSNIVENKFLWTWDARPYPTWPDRADIWQDSPCWDKGHWVQGKLGMVTLAALITDLALKSGLTPEMIDVSGLSDVVEGFVIGWQMKIRDVMEKLRQIYLFDVVEKDYKLYFVQRKSRQAIPIELHALVPTDDVCTKWREHMDAHCLLQVRNLHEHELPSKVSINFINRVEDYRVGNQYATYRNVSTKKSVVMNVPIVMDDIRAQKAASSILYSIWGQRQLYSFALPISYHSIGLGDVVEIHDGDVCHRICITKTELGQNYILKMYGVADDVTINYGARSAVGVERAAKYSVVQSINDDLDSIGQSIVETIDIPTLPNESVYKPIADSVTNNNTARARILIAACGTGSKWPGCFFAIRADNGRDDIVSGVLARQKSATMGKTVSILGAVSNRYLQDLSNSVIVNFIHGTLRSITEDELMAGKNMLLVGNEVVQFQYAELLAPFKYRLKGLLRGLFGTDKCCVKEHIVGERVVLLDENVQTAFVPDMYCGAKLALYMEDAVGNMRRVDDEENYTHPFDFTGQNILPLAPTHLRIARNGSVMHDENPGLVLSWYARDYVHNQQAEQHNNVQFRINLLSDDTVKSTLYTQNTSYVLSKIQVDGVNTISVCSFSHLAGYGPAAILTGNFV